MQDKEIKTEDLKEQISDLIANLKQFDFYLDNGATLQEYCNEKQDLINNFNKFIKDLKSYVDNQTFKEFERIENEMKNL